MKLWLLEQSVANDYDTFDSCIVAAETEQQAQETSPCQYHELVNGRFMHRQYSGALVEDTPYPAWALDPKDVTVRLIGEADSNVPAGVVLTSYNAG